MDNGYLQNKIREQNDKIIQLNIKLDKQKILLESFKRQLKKIDENVGNFLEVDISKVEDRFRKFMKEDIRNLKKEAIGRIKARNKKVFDDCLKLLLEKLDEKMVKELNYSMYFQMVLMGKLIEKDILSIVDTREMELKHNKLLRNGLPRHTKEEIDKIYKMVDKIVKMEVEL